jgi:hypothetical protein
LGRYEFLIIVKQGIESTIDWKFEPLNLALKHNL